MFNGKGIFFYRFPKPFLKKIREAAFIDRLAKFGDPLFDTFGAIAEVAGGSKQVVDGFGAARNWMKTARDFTALVNIFNGVIPSIITHCTAIVRLSKDMMSEEGRQAPTGLKFDSQMHGNMNGIQGAQRELLGEFDVKITDRHGQTRTASHYGKYNDYAVGLSEKVAAWFAQLGKGGGAVTFFGAFGFCRPIANVNKHILKHIGHEIDPVALKISEAFQPIMTANHALCIVGHTAEAIYQDLAFQREISGGRGNSAKYAEFRLKMKENAIGGVEKTLELVTDIVHHVGYASPAWFRCPIGLAIGGLSIWKEWIKTE